MPHNFGKGSPLGLLDDSKSNVKVFAQKGGGKSNTIYYNPKGAASGSATNGATKDMTPKDSTTYDLSLSSIISFLQGRVSTSVPTAAFAYLKDLGVYPNNRLMIARRFPGPVGDDIINEHANLKPISAVVGWVKDDDMSNAVSISFGEKWTDSIPDGLMSLLNDMISEMTGGGITLDALQGQLGSAGNEGGESAPGYTTILQFLLLKSMGFTDRSIKNLPQGDPNYVYAAKMREVGKNSGINCSIKVKMEVEYEQKFINNVDPTDIWMDILNNTLRFGGSPSSFYLDGNLTGDAKKIFDDFKNGRWGDAVSAIVKKLIEALGDLLKQLGEVVEKLADFSEGFGDGGADTGVLTSIGNAIGDLLSSIYRVKIQAVISALTGEPSAPWHVTIGNPKKPFFRSGDMICSDVDLSFGDVFAFNDLPATIKASFTLENARPLGIQEIMQKFGGAYGEGRKYQKGLKLLTDIESQVISAQADDPDPQTAIGNINTN